MPDVAVPDPRNKLVELIDMILDYLIKGFGAEATIIAATAYAPWLGYPVVREIFKQLITWAASAIDVWAKNNVDILVIRFQNDARKRDYDTQIENIKKPGVTPDEIKRAKDAINRLVHRSK